MECNTVSRSSIMDTAGAGVKRSLSTFGLCDFEDDMITSYRGQCL